MQGNKKLIVTTYEPKSASSSLQDTATLNDSPHCNFKKDSGPENKPLENSPAPP